VIRVTGAEEIARVAALVRAAGSDRRIVNDMAREIRRAVVPVRREIRARALLVLPRRGGLGKWVASARWVGVVRRGADSAGVSIRGGRNSRHRRTDLSAIDRGSTRHPTWGRPPWHAQLLVPGFASESVQGEGADQLERAVLVAADNAARRIAGHAAP
jgi:hypothetical protein